MAAIYAFAISAGMPIGSLAIGYAAKAWGTLHAVLLPRIGMMATILLVAPYVELLAADAARWCARIRACIERETRHRLISRRQCNSSPRLPARRLRMAPRAIQSFSSQASVMANARCHSNIASISFITRSANCAMLLPSPSASGPRTCFRNPERSGDTDKSYSQARDFRLLRHFGPDPRSAKEGHALVVLAATPLYGSPRWTRGTGTAAMIFATISSSFASSARAS